MPGPASPRGQRGFRGTPLTFDRGRTSKEILEIDWDYPVYDPDLDAVTTRSRSALPKDEVFRELAGDDRRPLLVVRECMSCQGSDVALLSTRHDNERTMLLTGWFHCVKLPPHVVDPEHPFHNLFAADDKPSSADDMAHLFLSRWDGSGRIDLDGTQSRSKLWKAMTKVLRRDYEGNPGRAVKELLKILNQFDRIDALEADLMDDLDRELERSGPDSPKIRKVQARLKALGEEHEALLATAQELRTLELRAPESEPEPGEERPGRGRGKHLP